MSVEIQWKAEPCPGALNGCLVDGNPEQIARQRKIKRRAIGISIVLQSAGLAALVIAPLFAKPAELSSRVTTPIPPYRSVAPHRVATTPTLEGPRNNTVCFTCFKNPPTLQSIEHSTFTPPPSDGEIDTGSGGQDNPHGILVIDTRPQPPPDVTDAHTPKHVVFETHIDPALLTHRVEPVFPPLARQIRRSGKVELHALIGTDGSIQRLQVVSGDPMFLQSALDAVREWRYKPTYLNGQPVEVDTYITVIYTLQQ